MKLKDFMAKHKITVVEMARWIGTSPPTIQAWKYGTTKVNVDAAIRIMALSGGEIELLDLAQDGGEEGGGWIPPIDYLEKHRPDLLTQLDKETKPTVVKARDASKEQLISPAKFTKAQA